MKVKDFQYINTIPTGITYNLEFAKYFNLDLNMTNEEMTSEFEEITKIKKKKLEKYIFVNGKKYIYNNDLKKCSFAQFIQLETLVNENDNVKNLHRLIALFCRPAKRKWFRYVIEPFDLETQNQIAENILEMEIEDAQELILFFYHLVENYSLNMKLHFLTEMVVANTKK